MLEPRIVTLNHLHSPTMRPAILVACFFLLLLTPDGSLRLTGYGASTLAGQLEVFLSGNWSAVCSEGFDYKAASVACKQMGLGSAVDYASYPPNRYGASVGNPLLPGLVCSGTELHLLRCPRSDWNVNETGCSRQQGASISCSNISAPYNGEVRLMGGALASQGSVEFYYNHQWAPLCARGFNWNVSHSLCRQLGYTGATVMRPSNNFNASFWTPLYSCDSLQTCFSNCTSTLSSSDPSGRCPEGGIWVECTYEQVNGAPLSPSGSQETCTSLSSAPSNVTVRLGGCGFPWCDGSVGRVELLYSSIWGTVCDSVEFTFREASVICGQLGFNSASRIYRDNVLDLGPGSGPMYSFSCLGVERSIADCTGFMYSPLYANCDHYDDAVLQCTSAFPPYGSLMLDEGAGSAGALLMFTGEGFQALCGAGFGEKEGRVACRQLGYPGLVAVKTGSYYSSRHTLCNTTRVFSCKGHESQMMECSSRLPLAGECRPGHDEVAVICSIGNNTIQKIDLTNSNSPMTGTLQVILYGEMGLVCGDGFGQAEGQVACRQLGYSTAAMVTPSIYTPGMGRILIGGVSCIGFEDRLDLCQYSLYSHKAQCNTTATLNCSQTLAEPQGSLRLIGGNVTSGQLQMYLNGKWAGLCGLLFTSTAASIACRQLGLGTPLDYCTNGCVHTGSDANIYFAQYDCSGDEGALLSCVTEEFKPSQCVQSAYVGLTCDVPLSIRAPSVAPGNTTTTQVLFGIKSLYFYIIVGSGGTTLLIVGVTIIGCIICLYRRRKQSEWSVSPDPPIYDTPVDNLAQKDLEKEHLRTIVISPMCMNVYEVESSRRVEPTPPPSYEEVEHCSSS